MKKAASKRSAARWVKAIVTYREIHHLKAGLGLVARLYVEKHAQLYYFARYTSPPFRLEIQILTASPLAALRKVIMGYRNQNVRAQSVTFEDCHGSTAHAVACQMVMTLAVENKLGGAMLADIFHWTLNMAGFSYIQEAGLLALQAHNALRGVPGWSETPVFGLRAHDAKKPHTA